MVDATGLNKPEGENERNDWVVSGEINPRRVGLIAKDNDMTKEAKAKTRKKEERKKNTNSKLDRDCVAPKTLSSMAAVGRLLDIASVI